MPNDCTTAGVFHKIGYRGLPSIALNFGDRDDCHGWLVGEPNRGIRCMFQLMNEARVGVGMQGRRHRRGRLSGGPRVREGASAGPSARPARSRARRRCRSSSTATSGACSCAKRRSSRAAFRSCSRPRATSTCPSTAPTPTNENAPPRCSTCSRRSPRAFPPRRASRPTCSRCRCTAATATPASTCRKRGCAIRSSTASTRAPAAFRAWICWAERSWPKAARCCASSSKK